MKKIIFWLAIIVITASVFALTIGQWLPVEFAEREIQDIFYRGIFFGLPIAILLTLTGTVKLSHSKAKNFQIIIITTIFTIGTFFYLVENIFTIGFGVWIDETIAYRRIDNPDHTIRSQLYDIGAFGYGGRRIIKTEPFLFVFETIEPVDTTNLDKSQWEYVDEPRDLKYP